MSIRSIYSHRLTSTRSIAGHQSFLFWFKTISLPFFSFLSSSFFFLFFTIDQICLAVTRHAHLYKSFPAGSTCHDRNSLHDDDLSLACASQDSAITVQPHVSSPLHPRFAFSRGDLGGKDDQVTRRKSNGPIGFSLKRRTIANSFLRLFRRRLWPPWWVGNRGESWLRRR